MRLLLVAFLITSYCIASDSPPLINFPPESEIFAQLKSVLKGKGDYFQKKVHRKGDNTIEVEGWVGIEAELDYAEKAARDTSRWNSWATKAINDPPKDGSYYMKLLELSPSTEMKGKDESEQFVRVRYIVDFPFLKREFNRTFKMTIDRSPKVLTLCGQTITPDKSLVLHAGACTKVFAAEKEPGRAWVYVKGVAKFSSWFLYEAFPEKLVMREIVDRIPVIGNNYVKEEDRLRAASSP